MTLEQRIADELKNAMRAKDQVALTVLRALKSALKYAEVAPGATGGAVSDAEAISVVRKQIKQRQDSIAQFEGAGRNDLADKEKAEVAVLETFLPKSLSEAELEALLTQALAETGATSKAQMGAVMKWMQEKAAGRVDGKTLSQAVMKKLG